MKKRTLSLAVSCLLPLCVQSDSVFGDNQATQAVEVTGVDYEEIVVTSTRSPYAIGRVPTTVRVIDAAQIQRSGAPDVVELLRNYGSVQIRDSSGINTASGLSLRGFATSQNVLVLVDGQKLNNTDLSGVDLRGINMSDVERVEILEGGAGALYGDQAVGGVVNIITRAGGSRSARVRVGSGSYSSEVYEASVADETTAGLYYRLGTEILRSDAYRDETHLNSESYSVRLGQRYDAGQVFVDARKDDSEYLLSGALFASQLASDRRQAGSSFNDYATIRDSWRAGVEHRFSDAVQVLASYSDRNEKALIAAESSFGSTDSVQDRRVRSFDPRIILSNEQWRATLGYDRELVDYGYAIDFGFGPSLTEQSHRKSAEYLHLLYSPTENLDLQAGVRHAQVKIGVAPYDIDYGRTATVHTLGASWRQDNWRLYINRDETFRFPLADENIDFLGNLNLLDVQRGVAWELGNSWSWTSWDVSLAVFQQDNRDEIAYDPGLGFYGANTNLDDTRRRGASAELGWRGGQWQVRSIYTYTDATFEKGVYSGNRIPDVARHLYKMNASYQANDQLSVVAELLYVGSRELDFTNSADSLGGYTVLNLASTWAFNNWTLQARINNVTAKEYTEFVSFFGAKAFFPSSERNINVSLAYDF